MLLKINGMREKYLENSIDLHDFTGYKMRWKEGVNDVRTPARGLQKGCSTSPILFFNRNSFFFN